MTMIVHSIAHCNKPTLWTSVASMQRDYGKHLMHSQPLLPLLLLNFVLDFMLQALRLDKRQWTVLLNITRGIFSKHSLIHMVNLLIV